MILKKIELRSFRQFVETDIVLDEGITAIVGPNGAGKTTVLEAVKYALYGIPCRGKLDDLPNMYHGGDMSVAIEFTLGNDVYRCERSKSKASLSKLGDGEDQRIAFGLNGVKSHVVKLLGLTAEQFSNSYFTEQKQIEFLNFSAKDKQQQQVSQMLGIEVLAVASKVAREKSKASAVALDQMQSIMESKDALLESIKTKRCACDSATEALKNAEKQLGELHARLGQLEPKCKAAEEWKLLEISIRERADLGRQLEKDLKEVAASLKSAQAEFDERNLLEPTVDEFAKLSKQHEEMSNLRGALSDKERWILEKDTKTKEIADIESKLTSNLDQVLSDLEAKSAAIEKQIGAARASLDAIRNEWNQKVSEQTTTLRHLQQNLAEAEAEMELVREAEAKGICPTCEQPLPDGHAPRSATLGALIEKLRTRIGSVEAALKALESEPPELEKAKRAVMDKEAECVGLTRELLSVREHAAVQRGQAEKIASLKLGVGELQKKIDAAPTAFDQAAFDQLGAALKALEPKRDRWQELAGAPARLKAASRQHKEKSDQFELERKRQTSDRKRMDELGLDRESAERIINDFKQAQGSLPHVQKIVADCKSALESARSVLEDAEQRLARWHENAEKIEVHRHDRDLYREVGDALHELRAKLNREIRPTLAAFAADALAQITANRYTRISIDDAFGATLIDGDHTKNVISGGEEDILALSLRIALSRYIQEKSGLPLTLLVLDEVFGSLDAERRANVLELLTGLRGMFPQIILVSHVDGLVEHADRVLRISYDPAAMASTVQEVCHDTAISL